MGRKKNRLVKKTVNFYKYVFKFDPPFKVVLDGNFIAVAKKKKFDIKEIIQKTLDEKVHVLITSCVVNELREFESKIPGLLASIMKYKIEECTHKDFTPEACIKSMIGHKNKKKYIVASQDVLLRSQLRKSVAVPLIFFDQNMLLVERPSKATMDSYDRVLF